MWACAKDESALQKGEHVGTLNGSTARIKSRSDASTAPLGAAPLVFTSVAPAVPIGMTPAWHAFAALLNRTIGPHI